MLYPVKLTSSVFCNLQDGNKILHPCLCHWLYVVVGLSLLLKCMIWDVSLCRHCPTVNTRAASTEQWWTRTHLANHWHFSWTHHMTELYDHQRTFWILRICENIPTSRGPYSWSSLRNTTDQTWILLQLFRNGWPQDMNNSFMDTRLATDLP